MQTKKLLLFLLLVFVLMSKISLAHQPNLSSLIISKTENNTYVLQLNCSLTAFESEVEYHYGKNAFKTPEEFNELVLKIFKQKTTFEINGESIAFLNPVVILGHETKVLAEIKGMPKDISSLEVTCSVFKEISNNQTTLIILKEGFPQEQFLLNNENDHELRLTKENGLWVHVVSNDIFSWKNVLSVLLIFSVFAVFFLVVRRVKKASLINTPKAF